MESEPPHARIRQREAWNIRNVAARTALIYGAVSFVWILASDRLVGMLTSDPRLLERISIAKGWFFVGVTAMMLYVLVRRQLRHIEREAEARQRATEALADQRQRLDNIIEGTHVGTWEWDVQTGALVVNERWAEILGYTLAELAPISIKTWEAYAHPADLLESERILEKHFSGATSHYDLECRMRHRDGRWIWVHDRGRLQSRDAQGRPLMMFGTHTDITVRKSAELAVRASEERQRLFFEHAPAALAIFDREMRYLAASRRWSEDFDVAGRSLIGRSHYEVFPELSARLREVHQRALAGEILQSESDRFERPDGRVQWLRWEVRPWFDGLGGIGGIAIFSEDITALHESSSALRESEARFRQITENINEVFWIIDGADAAGQLSYVIPAYDSLWGRSREGLIRGEYAWISTVHPDDQARMERALDSSRSGDDPFDETYRIVRPDGTVRWIHDRAFVLRDAAGRVYRTIGTAEDVTERRSLEEQIRHAQKMQAIGTLAGGIAHDFNNLLGAITGFTEIARTQVKDRPDVTENLDDVLRAGKRAISLVRQILAFSRRASSEKVLMQLRPVVDEAVHLLRSTIPSNIGITCDLGRDVPAVVADPTQVHQVIMNLGTNAWHAMRDRPGEIEMSLDRVTFGAEQVRDEPRVRVGVFARISVRDSGCGIPPADLERIFEPFFTTKAPGDGTGLGLSVVHGIVREHDGFITVDSVVGVGSTFSVHLPVAEIDAPSQVGDSGAAPQGRGERVLIVDDEPVLVRLGVNLLETLGYAATGAVGAEQALDALARDGARFDLVITDQTMPVMCGTTLAGQIRSTRPSLPVIIVTGRADELTPESVQQYGVADLLLKPLSLGTLGTATHRALHRKCETLTPP